MFVCMCSLQPYANGDTDTTAPWAQKVTHQSRKSDKFLAVSWGACMLICAVSMEALYAGIEAYTAAS